MILPFISPKQRPKDSDHGSLQVELGVCQTKLNVTESKIDALSARLADTQNSVTDSHGEIRALERKVARVEQTEALVSKSFAMITAVQKELKGIKASVKENGGLTGDNTDKDSKEIQEMKQRLEKAEDDSERMEGIVADLQKQISALIVKTYKFMQGDGAEQPGKKAMKQERTKEPSRFPYH